uniref:40S ribosomal protein S17 n=1 Tax=Sexangularia sp. CB-2014 TaxID=1486929 RepID=A0A7S1YC11_9EUKA|mmetsp:Transcript_12629/g.39904  ORF Transcript_12629/g.39904 Transcript_12629/m.39904 type:complete len:141 (+) Transcript_12629:93-515(+)|eukprot:CAMPEP_0170746250 /NCGR_PEP_ID=MMETSP0437-20130122/8711_1 /TAXON_ID=0 /ORGANISM="Sexangularia sp." /LENGTH=140 /DNA_ID=CAMNT_0011084993 /DNA_START=125 /DNA_END=547 /DNA_ORIENTATION=-
MGRVRTGQIKKAAKLIVEKYYPRLTLDFQVNKKLTDEIAIVPSKRIRNKVAGYVTHLMKRMEKGPVRGISIKLQEEERERRDNFVPDVSAVNVEKVEVDAVTMDMLNSFDMGGMKSLQVVSLTPGFRGGRDNRAQRPRRD